MTKKLKIEFGPDFFDSLDANIPLEEQQEFLDELKKVFENMDTENPPGTLITLKSLMEDGLTEEEALDYINYLNLINLDEEPKSIH